MKEPVLFSCGDDQYSPAHVLCAAAFWGDIDALYLDAHSRLNALNRAHLDGRTVPDEALQSTSEQFRRTHGLRTVQATEAWMRARGVSVESFSAFLERDALRTPLAGQLSTPSSRKHPASDAPVLSLLWPDAVFTGAGDRWTQQLAARAAAAREIAGETSVPISLFEARSADSAEAIGPWLESFGLGKAWFDRMRALESAYACFSNALHTPTRLDAALRARWSTLFGIEIEMGGFENEAAAREACLCVSEDGSSVQEVSSMAGAPFHRGRVLLGDLPESIRAHALSSEAGATLPVFPWNGNHIVCRVHGKFEPTLSDPDVRETVGRLVLEEALHPLMKRHIAWPPWVIE